MPPVGEVVEGRGWGGGGWGRFRPPPTAAGAVPLPGAERGTVLRACRPQLPRSSAACWDWG